MLINNIKMKKLIISITLLFCGLIIYGQIPAPTTPQTLNNGEQMLIIRTKTNTNFTNIGAYASRLRDTLNAHNIRLLALEDSSLSFATRLDIIEAGGIGGSGSTYTFTNGLTELSGTVSLGGTLGGTTNINTGTTNDFRLYSVITAPSTGTRMYNSFGYTQNYLSNLTYSSGVISTGGTLTLNPTTGFSLYGRTGSKVSIFTHTSSGPQLQSDISSSGNYRTITLTTAGLIEGADYSGSYGPLSLTNKTYVDAVATGVVGDRLSVDTLFTEDVVINSVNHIRTLPGYDNMIYFDNDSYTGIASLQFLNTNTTIFSVDVLSLPPTSTVPSFEAGRLYITNTDKFLLGTTSQWDTISVERKGVFYVNDSVHFSQAKLSSGDTSALAVIGSTEKLVAMPLVPPASRGWEIKLPSYLQFYLDSKKHKALPLTYPDLGTPELHGQDRREINKMHGFYQVEFELERLHRFLFRQWTENKLQWIVILLLSIGFLKQRKEIKLLKSKI